MKKIKLYEEFVGEAYKFYDLFFNSHIDHNPECDILEGHLDKDSLITYGIYIKGPKEGLEFMEYYSGSNYKPTSDKRSNSKLFMVDKIPAKYKAMWEDLKKIYENEYAGSGRVSTRNEALVVEGQFSWMAQDTGRQIGSERENTITVYMFDDKGQKWEEKKYDGYGEFGGKDYYELLAQMNGVENADRQDGIDIAFGKTKTKGKTLFPALVEDPKHFNYKRHDFTVQPDNDPNQSWYQEEEYDDDDDNYDDSDESKVTEATSYDPDDIFFLWDDCVDNGREGIERGHTGRGSSKHELFTFDTEVDGYDKFETELKKLLKKSGWKNEYNQDTLKVYESRINEDETLIFDEVGEHLVKLQDQIDAMLKWDMADPKWISALKGIQSACNKVEDAVAKADQKLGAIEYNEAKVNEGSTISVPKLSDIDHTRIIKWMSNQFDSKSWDMKKSGKGFEITIDKLSKAEQKDLMAYLKSQDYITENEASIDVDVYRKKQAFVIGPKFAEVASDSDVELMARLKIVNSEHEWQLKQNIKSMDHLYKKYKLRSKKGIEESVVNESHFKVGDKVKMSHGGYGVIKSLDKESGADDEKYYNVELPSGEMHKHSPNELTKESAMSDIDLLAQEAKDFKSFVKEFKKEYKNMDAGSAKELEAWLQSVYDGAKANESVVTEAKDVKSEVIDKLSQFFGVSTGALIKFNFDGKDDIKALTKALNGTDYEGVDNIVRVAVKAAKRDLGVDEAIKPAGLTKDETLKVAQKFAEAISKVDGVKCTVNTRTLEEDSFDLDYADEEFAGGSYNIYQNGDVINMAVGATPLYGKKNDSVDAIVKNIKKMR
jgi:hypothetical protein